MCAPEIRCALLCFAVLFASATHLAAQSSRVFVRVSDDASEESGVHSIDSSETGLAPVVNRHPSWVVDTGVAAPLADWVRRDEHVTPAQFQPSILPESFGGLGVRRPSASTAAPVPTSSILASAGLQSPVGKSPVITVSAQQSLLQTHATGIDSLLLSSKAASGQRRQPTASEIVIAGRRKGQTPGGSHWIPTREDLDTFLSKIDARLVRRVEVTEGPYNVMEGPGLAFVDVELLPAPRFSGGFQSQGMTFLSYQTNGEQWHGRQSFEGGDDVWGYRIGYTHLTGNDYEAGDGTEFPASYNSRLPDVALGANLTDNSTIDYHYLRMDQTDVEFPGQVFDIDWLVTDAHSIIYRIQDQRWFDLLYVEGWYNRTRFEGTSNIDRKNSRLEDVLQQDGTTDADAMTAGGTSAFTWDGVDKYLTIGSDFRFAKQRLNERLFRLVQLPSGGTLPFPIDSYIPRSESIDPGVFFESAYKPSATTRTRFGGRVDWVDMDADETQPGVNTPTTEQLGVQPGDFDRDFTLWSTFVEWEHDINTHWSHLLAAGHSMRPPTMSELYANGPFMAVMPQFLLNRPRGNPLLNPERLWQIDVGLNYDSDQLRVGMRGFHGWVQDYITFDRSPQQIITDPNVVTGSEYTWVNTDLATLAGGRAFFEYDHTAMVSWFGQVSYVEGRDHTRFDSNSPLRTQGERSAEESSREEPLPVIPPLEGEIGLRLHDDGQGQRWLVDFVVRIVDNQDRIATSLAEQPTPGFTTVDIRGFYFPCERWRLSAGVENLGNRHYQDHFDPHRILGAEVFRLGRNFFFATELYY